MEHSATADAATATATTPFAHGAIGSEWAAERLKVLLHLLLRILLRVLHTHRRGRRHLRRVGGARGRGC